MENKIKSIINIKSIISEEDLAIISGGVCQDEAPDVENDSDPENSVPEKPKPLGRV